MRACCSVQILHNPPWLVRCSSSCCLNVSWFPAPLLYSSLPDSLPPLPPPPPLSPTHFPPCFPPPPPLTSVFFLWGLTVLFCTVGWIPGIRPPLITYYLCGKKASEAQICRGFESNWFTGKLLKRELGLAFPDGCSRRQKEPTVRVSLVSKLAIIPRAHNQKFLGW